ncbi:MAG: lysylphosphatidylglycerol synthase transmembrane domain-containing protein [Sphingobacteriaceae bacterium]
MKLRIISIIKYLLFLSLAFFLLYWAFRGQNISLLLKSLKNANYFWISISALACLVAHVLRAIRWTMLIKPLGYQITTKNAFYAVMVGYLANLAFPRMGEVSRCGVLTKTDKVPIDQLVGTVITERFFDFLFLLSITGLAIALEFERIAGFIYQNGWLKIQHAFADNFLLIGLGVAVSVVILFFLLKNSIKRLLKPFSKTLQGFKNGVLSFKKMPNQIKFLFFSSLIWLFYFLSTYLCFFALGATSNLGLLAGLATLVFGSLGMIVPVQGGIGAFHFMVAEGLTLYGIPKTMGLTFAAIIHSSQILVILLIGGWSLLLVLLQHSKNSQAQTD